MKWADPLGLEVRKLNAEERARVDSVIRALQNSGVPSLSRLGGQLGTRMYYMDTNPEQSAETAEYGYVYGGVGRIIYLTPNAFLGANRRDVQGNYFSLILLEIMIHEDMHLRYDFDGWRWFWDPKWDITHEVIDDLMKHIIDVLDDACARARSKK